MTLEFQRTRDYELVRSILTHPKLYGHITDDFAPAPADFKLPANEAIWYVLVFDDGDLMGAFAFFPQSPVWWEVHTCLLPGAWGAVAAEAAREMARWIWATTGCRRITTNVPRYNRLARNFALAAGMTEYGCNPASYLKRGKLHDQILLGLSKPTEENTCRL